MNALNTVVSVLVLSASLALTNCSNQDNDTVSPVPVAALPGSSTKNDSQSKLSSAAQSPILPNGYGDFQSFVSLQGTGVINGVPYTWISKSRNSQIPYLGGSSPKYPILILWGPWLDKGMITTVTFSKPIHNLGFLVTDINTSFGKTSDVGAVTVNGKPYRLSDGELIDTYSCGSSVFSANMPFSYHDWNSAYMPFKDSAPRISDGFIVGGVQAWSPEDKGGVGHWYSVVRLLGRDITSFSFQMVGDGGKGAGFAGIFAPVTIKSNTGGL